jgi:hypothetical protein
LGGDDEIGQFMGAVNDVGLIENAFGKAPEKSRHGSFKDLSARRKQCRTRCQSASQRHEIILITASAMQQE